MATLYTYSLCLLLFICIKAARSVARSFSITCIWINRESRMNEWSFTAHRQLRSFSEQDKKLLPNDIEYENE